MLHKRNMQSYKNKTFCFISYFALSVKTLLFFVCNPVQIVIIMGSHVDCFFFFLFLNETKEEDVFEQILTEAKCNFPI